MTRAFSYLDHKNLPCIGVEWSDNSATEANRYNFTRAWDFFSQIKLDGKGPQLNFLQVMVELDLFLAETFDEVFKTLQEFRPLKDLILTEGAPVQVPIARPQKILCIGRNYREHAKELKNPVPQEPVFFAKATSALLAHEEPVRLPAEVGRVDHEAELALVIGKSGSRINQQTALEHVAGYSILNDVTARELQKQDVAAGLPWFRAKSFDSFCPMGPYLVPAGCVPDPHQLDISLTVNGEVRQRASTADMIFSIGELISFVSRFCTLQPGDIIATGTPEGVGPINHGDVIAVSITGLGELQNPVV